MKILLVHSDMSAAGGAESYCDDIRNALENSSHSVDLLDISTVSKFGNCDLTCALNINK